MGSLKNKTAASVPAAPAFFVRQPVFRLADFAASDPGRSANTVKALLNYHVQQGNLLRLRRGVYLEADFWDPWAIAAHLTADAVLAYDGAFALQRAWKPPDALAVERVCFLTANPNDGHFDAEGGIDFHPVRPPKALGDSWAKGTATIQHQSVPVRLTAWERTLVDLLERPDLSPPPLELWEAFAYSRPDPRKLVAHARALGSKAAAARLGFFLEQLPGVPEASLEALLRLRPASPVYFERSRRRDERQRYVGRWNLVVPLLVEQTVTRTEFRRERPRIPKLRY